MATVIDTYIKRFPPNIQKLLKQMRALIRKLVPEASETIAYGVPTFVLRENLVHFAAYKTHIGFYPGPAVIKEFEKEISKYRSAKGSVQFPTDQPLPLTLVSRMVRHRLKSIEQKRPKVSFDFPKSMGKPALRALAKAGLKDLKFLSKYTEAEVSELHGMGPKAIKELKAAMRKGKIKFKSK